ncbi:unnamed protein product [Camellia sinensis]
MTTLSSNPSIPSSPGGKSLWKDNKISNSDSEGHGYPGKAFAVQVSSTFTESYDDKAGEGLLDYVTGRPEQLEE